MKAADNYLEINKTSWNTRTEAHLTSDFYDVAGFLKGRSSLNAIELDLLKDVKGKSILHLQCHFGQDTISLARMGANATGVDLSDKAIAAATGLAAECGAAASFICCDVFDLPKHLDEKFDIVFTSYGTIGWLPDLDKWAGVISHFLKSGGEFVFAEFHPVVWMFDDNFTNVSYRYFKSDPIVETEKGTYADRSSDLLIQSVSWNHGMAEVITALLSRGLVINTLREFDYSPYNCFNNMVEFEPGKFRTKNMGDKIPMVYALKTQLPA